jgi:hypothetical protein
MTLTKWCTQAPSWISWTQTWKSDWDWIFWTCQWVAPQSPLHHSTGKWNEVPFHTSVDSHSQQRHLATNEQAWQESHDLPGMTYITFPADAMLWATAATSWGHINDHGMAMIIKVMTGRKGYLSPPGGGGHQRPPLHSQTRQRVNLSYIWEKESLTTHLGRGWTLENSLRFTLPRCEHKGSLHNTT